MEKKKIEGITLVKALENITKELEKIAENTEDIGCTLDEILEKMSGKEEETEEDEDEEQE